MIKLFVSTVMIMSLVVATLAPGSVNAATCSKTACNGKDPAATGCNQNAYIAKRVRFIEKSTGIAMWEPYMDVYYSPTCGTNWIRVTANPYCGNVYKEIQVLKADGSNGFFESESDTGCGSSYSMQVYAPGATKVRTWAKLQSTSGATKASTDIIVIGG